MHASKNPIRAFQANLEVDIPTNCKSPIGNTGEGLLSSPRTLRQGEPMTATTLGNKGSPLKLRRQKSIKDPTNSNTERSRQFNVFFGVFFALGSLTSGYNVAIMGPLGEKFIRIHYGLENNASMLLGFSNLVWALGGLLGSMTSVSVAYKIGPIKLLFYGEILQVVASSFMLVNNIWVFFA